MFLQASNASTVLTATNNASGNYVLAGLCPGTYSITPTRVGFKFYPPVVPVTLQSDTNGVDFAALPGFMISRGTNGSVLLSFAATPGLTYQILASTNLVAKASTNLAYWQLIFTTNNTSTNFTLFQFTDPDATTLPRRFYRLAEFLAGPAIARTANGPVRLSFLVAPEFTYQIQASTNLMPPWTSILTTNNVSPNTVVFEFLDTEVTHFPVRFYRVARITPGS